MLRSFDWTLRTSDAGVRRAPRGPPAPAVAGLAPTLPAPDAFEGGALLVLPLKLLGVSLETCNESIGSCTERVPGASVHGILFHHEL